MSFHKEDHTIAVAGGAGSFVSDHPWRGLLWQLIVEPTSPANDYTLTITDEKGDMVISYNNTGQLNSALEMPVRGSYTFTISGATIDEDIRVRPIVREPVYAGS